jgi:hypothetical protein
LKKILLYILTFLIIAGCSTFQRVDDLEERFTALEEAQVMEDAAGGVCR